MRNIKLILEEIHTQSNKDNCQSWNSIALNAMEQALKEQKEEILLEEGVHNTFPEWNSAFLSKVIDRDILYEVFK